MSRPTLDTNLAVVNDIVDTLLKTAPRHVAGGLKPGRRADLRRLEAHRLAAQPRFRHGRRARLGAYGEFVAMETGFSVRDITAMVLGGHGDTMVPMTRFTRINGIPIEHFLTKEQIQKIVERTRGGGRNFCCANRERLRCSGGRHRRHGGLHQPQSPPYPSRRGGAAGEYGLHDIGMGVPVVLARTAWNR
jgi:malate dehydrogenase